MDLERAFRNIFWAHDYPTMTARCRTCASGSSGSLTSPSAERTARVVVDALIHGDAERAVSFGSWLGARAQGLAPNAMARGLRSLHRRLPPAGPLTSSMQLGSEVAAASQNEAVQRLAQRARADEARYLPDSIAPDAPELSPQ